MKHLQGGTVGGVAVEGCVDLGAALLSTETLVARLARDAALWRAALLAVEQATDTTLMTAAQLVVELYE